MACVLWDAKNAGLCSSRTRWPPAPNFCSRATRKSQIFHTNHMLGYPGFYRFRALGSLQFSLEHSLGMIDRFKDFLVEYPVRVISVAVV